MKVQVDMPDKISQRETHIASCETDRKGMKARLEQMWRPYRIKIVRKNVS